jgi:hypothetical protein
MLMFLVPTLAALVILKIALIVVEVLLKLPLTTLIPEPSPVSPVAPAKLVPVRVTGT